MKMKLLALIGMIFLVSGSVLAQDFWSNEQKVILKPKEVEFMLGYITAHRKIGWVDNKEYLKDHVKSSLLSERFTKNPFNILGNLMYVTYEAAECYRKSISEMFGKELKDISVTKKILMDPEEDLSGDGWNKCLSVIQIIVNSDRCQNAEDILIDFFWNDLSSIEIIYHFNNETTCIDLTDKIWVVLEKKKSELMSDFEQWEKSFEQISNDVDNFYDVLKNAFQEIIDLLPDSNDKYYKERLKRYMNEKISPVIIDLNKTFNTVEKLENDFDRLISEKEALEKEEVCLAKFLDKCNFLIKMKNSKLIFYKPLRGGFGYIKKYLGEMVKELKDVLTSEGFEKIAGLDAPTDLPKKNMVKELKDVLTSEGFEKIAGLDAPTDLPKKNKEFSLAQKTIMSALCVGCLAVAYAYMQPQSWLGERLAGIGSNLTSWTAGIQKWLISHR